MNTHAFCGFYEDREMNIYHRSLKDDRAIKDVEELADTNVLAFTPLPIYRKQEDKDPNILPWLRDEYQEIYWQENCVGFYIVYPIALNLINFAPILNEDVLFDLIKKGVAQFPGGFGWINVRLIFVIRDEETEKIWTSSYDESFFERDITSLEGESIEYVDNKNWQEIVIAMEDKRRGVERGLPYEEIRKRGISFMKELLPDYSGGTLKCISWGSGDAATILVDKDGAAGRKFQKIPGIAEEIDWYLDNCEIISEVCELLAKNGIIVIDE